MLENTEEPEQSERPITKRLRSTQHHPATFWTMAGLVVFGFLWGLWTYAQTKPTRAISYEWRTESIVKAEHAAILGTAFDLSNLGSSNIYLNHIRVWNSGNHDILAEHFFLPLKISYPPDVFMVEVRHFNVPLENLVGDVRNSFQFEKLFPGGGVLVTFVSLGRPDTRVVEGQIYGIGDTRPPDNRSPELFLGISAFYAWIIVFLLVASTVFVRFKSEPFGERLFYSFMLGFFTTMLLSFSWIIIRGLFFTAPF